MSSRKVGLGLPHGWCWATVGDTGRYINGFAFKPGHREAAGRPIVRIQNLTDSEKPLNRTSLTVPEDFHVATGEMLLSWSATVDVFLWNREPALVNQHIFRVVPDEGVVDKTFLFHWLKVAIDQLLESEHLHGSTMKHINRGPFMAHQIPLPPLREQQRIAETLEELLSDLDAGVAELKAAQRKLAQYRQSLLKAAVEGALTADWRAAQGTSSRRKPGSSLSRDDQPQKRDPGLRRDDEGKETGAELLQRILSERRARWEQRQLAKFAEQGKTPPKGWQDKYPEPVAPDLTDLPLLPEGWVWASIDQLSPGDLANGRSVPTAEAGPKVLRLTAVREGRIDLDEWKYGAWSEAEARPFAVAEGDLLIVRGNGSLGLVGRAGLVGSVQSKIAYPDTLIRLRVLDTVVRPEWISLVWDSELSRNHFERRARTSAGIYKISQPDIISAVMPVPPLAEQSRIIEEFENHRERIASTEQMLTAGVKQAAAQHKNILKAAFSGQLVPQDPNDEPASVLLARIRAQREANAGTPARKRGRKARGAA